MPNLTLFTLTAPSLPTNYCPLSYQNLANDIIEGTQVTFNSTIGNSFFNFGPSIPAINNRIYPWLDENGQWWIFSQGVWLYKNTVVAGGYDRRIFVGTTTDLLSYDGGDGTAVAGDTFGPMWMVDTSFDARFPVGAGTFAASGAVAVNGTATATSIVGEDKHTLNASEIPTHNHNVRVETANGVTVSNLMCTDFAEKPAGNGNNDFSFQAGIHVVADNFGGGLSHNNLPPFYGVYFIKRTSRIYYTK
jgi:hypothetical protein